MRLTFPPILRPLRTLAAGLPLVLCAAFTLAVATARVEPPTQPALTTAGYADHAPLTGFNAAQRQPGGLQVTGWAYDPDQPTTATVVSAFVDGRSVTHVYATVPRPDLARVHRDAGPNHGFSFAVPVPEGMHSICLWAANVGLGSSVRFQCVSGRFDYGPVVMLDQFDTSPGELHLRGWAYDDDAPTAALSLVLGVDSGRYLPVANLPRPDQASRLHGGIDHGFEITMPAPQGTHHICLTVRNVGLGSDTVLPCRDLVLDDRPTGHVDVVGQQAGRLHVTGWALDVDAPTTPLGVRISVDGASAQTYSADVSRPDVGQRYPGTGTDHGFDVSLPVTEGKHTVQVSAVNVGIGTDRDLGAVPISINFTPQLAVGMLGSTSTTVVFNGWAFDPDTPNPIGMRVIVDGRWIQTLVANGAGPYYPGHWWSTTLLLTSGTHEVCVEAANVLYGTHDTRWCRSITLAYRPVGRFDQLSRVAGGIGVLGWAADPDAAHTPLSVVVTLDGHAVSTVRAAAVRGDVSHAYPSLGAYHGVLTTIPANDGEHTVCLTALNVGGGVDTPLGCKLIIAVHPVVPSAPTTVVAVPGFGAAAVSWRPPTSDGGAPWTRYVITSVPDGRTVSVAATTLRANLIGLRSHIAYRFTVSAVNVAGASPAGVSAAVITQTAPPPQTTPAPVSTSRYIRNVRGSSPAELALMRAEGAADARANPAGHGYLVLLDIGGQYGDGVILSAGVRYVSYYDLARDIGAYVDGYHSGQGASAPVTIAIGTNNDINVTSAAGRDWADRVVDPVRAWAGRYTGIAVAGANDIEPGFSAGYAATLSWLSGYLGATTAAFVFNGSADGCAWTTINRACNNGWSMYGLYRLAAGAAPTRIVNLPQVYNTTMGAQWKYISLTGVAYRQPRINFGGPLTEWTACTQSGSCGSMTGRSAWVTLWADLRSDPHLRVASLPYSTDLRIDRS